ncbi:MAG: hypothetical protein ACTSPY_08885 [Candidatus Helarchaeota archaeon]
MLKKFEKNICRGVKTAKSLPYHMPEKFFYPILMSSRRVPDSRFWCYYFYIPNISEDLAKNPGISWADRHRHPEGTDEIYMIIGDPGAITVEVSLGNGDEMEIYEISSPGSVFIPAGISHSIKPIKMIPNKSGGIIAIVSNGEYKCLPPI